MATSFGPCYGVYVLNQFPSIVMLGMKGFHVSASEAIQGHHSPLVQIDKSKTVNCCDNPRHTLILFYIIIL